MQEICYSCLELAFLSKFGFLFDGQCLVERSWLWETKIYVWQFRSCVQFRYKWQAIIREETRLHNAGFKWCYLKLSRPEFLLTIFLANNANDGSYTVLTASCERSFSKLKLVLSYFRASLINNKSGKVMWYSFDENRKGGNSKRLLYFDEIINDFASVKARRLLFCFN